MPITQPGTTVRFGLFELDTEVQELHRGSVRIRLAKQPFDLLIALIEQPGEVISREALQQRLWPPDTFVDYDHGLNKTVRKLREVLGDSAESPRYIETIQRIGYRFIAPVTTVSKSVENSPVTEDAKSTENSSEPRLDTTSVPARLTRRRVFLLGGATLLGGGVIWLRRSLLGRSSERAMDVVLPLPVGTAAADPGHTLGAPVVAPNGAAAVVALTTDEGIFLYIRHLEADRLVRMEGTRGAGQPFWSPDSLHIGFFADSKLKRMPVAGGDAVTLCDAPVPRGGAWGISGVILFGLNFHGIYQILAAGGAATQITNLDKLAGENSHRNPAFLPDGARFLYLARTDDPEKRAIYTESLQSTSGRQRVGLADGEFALARDPETDSWYLLTQQAEKIVAQSFDVRRGKLTGVAHVLLDHRGTISASDTGILVTRTEQQMLARLLWFDREGRQLSTVGDADDYWNVAISPDGQRLAVVRHNFLTGQFRVWTASCERGLLEPLSESNHAAAAVWSRDSTTVYYTDIRQRKLLARQLSANSQEQVVMDLAGSQDVLVDDISAEGDIAIGELITNGDHAQIAWSLKRTHPEWRTVDASGQQGLHAKLSPDGKWLAFSSFDSGRSEIYVMKFPSGEQRRRISDRGGHTPRWRRDGRELFFVANDGGMMSVDLSARRTSDASPKKLFQTNLRLGSDRPLYDVTGDGQRFLMSDGGNRSSESNVELVLHWPSLLNNAT